MKKILALFLSVLLIFSLTCCKNQEPAAPAPEADGTVTRDPKYNAANVSLSQEALEAAGFVLGDSCDVAFENGYTLTDVPYYNGYYVKNGQPVVVAYPGFDYISITFNNHGIWEDAGLAEDEGVSIRLNTAGKFAAVQETLGQVYSTDYAAYPSSVEFCNFRALTGGNLKENFLYRGASPVDSSRGRAPYTDDLLEKKKIAFVVDLADSEENIQGYFADSAFDSPYSAGLYQNGQIVLLDMGSSYTSEVYQQKVAEGMRAMMNAAGPAYIHCMEGKDRTGFVCMLLEALAGASYEQMQTDYMLTYRNYYGVSANETPEKYAAIAALYFDPFVSYLHGTEDLSVLKTADYTQDAVRYLMSGGLSTEEVKRLQNFITH